MQKYSPHEICCKWVAILAVTCFGPLNADDRVELAIKQVREALSADRYEAYGLSYKVEYRAKEWLPKEPEFIHELNLHDYALNGLPKRKARGFLWVFDNLEFQVEQQGTFYRMTELKMGDRIIGKGPKSYFTHYPLLKPPFTHIEKHPNRIFPTQYLTGIVEWNSNGPRKEKNFDQLLKHYRRWGNNCTISARENNKNLILRCEYLAQWSEKTTYHEIIISRELGMSPLSITAGVISGHGRETVESSTKYSNHQKIGKDLYFPTKAIFSDSAFPLREYCGQVEIIITELKVEDFPEHHFHSPG